MSRIIAVVSGAIRRLEMRFTPKGTAILDLMMAGKVAQGGAEYLSFAAPRFLGRYAEALAEQVKEGDALLVTGELVQERWEQDGQKRSRLRILGRSAARINAPHVAEDEHGPLLVGATNRVAISGNLVDAPEVREVGRGSLLGRMTVAAHASKDRVHFVTVKAWEELAEAMRPLKKGDPVYVEGRLRTERWNREDGGVAYLDVVVASSVIGGERVSVKSQEEAATNDEDDLPF